MDLGEKLTQKMATHNVFEIDILGFTIPVADSIIVMWIVMAILIVSALFLTRKMKTIPEGKQNIAELIVEFVNNFAKSNIGHHWRHFAAYLGTIALFLVVANTISVLNEK